MSLRSKFWVIILVSVFSFVVGIICITNYLVDPYGLYKMDFFINKPRQAGQMRLIKLIQLREQRPVSIILGTSRADMAIDPEHEYFIKPSYNLSNSGASIYEVKYYVEEAIKLGTKNILLVADWRMFNDTMKKIDIFESYFNNFNIYSFLISYNTFKDSIFTIKNQNLKNFYFTNGLLDDSLMWGSIKASGGHFNLMKKDERNYYKAIYSNNNIYGGTTRNSFQDFDIILNMCYKNNIKLDIVFGPSHIRQWEALAYYKGEDTFSKWKKDIVLHVAEIAKNNDKEPFRVIDFSVYHQLTAEEVPINKDLQMRYHWEGSHYKKELGDIVLDRLLDISPYKDFGIELNSQNIDNHIKKLRDDREKYIDIKKYRQEVFGEN